MAVLVKGVPHIVRRAPLGAVAGNQEKGVLQPLAEGADIGGVGGPSDRPGHGVAVLALGSSGDALVQVAHHLIHLPVSGQDILQLPGAGVGGFHQHENAFVLGLGRLQKGLDGVGAHVAVEGDAVGIEGFILLPLDFRPGQPALGVGGGGGADVPPLDIRDDEQALFPGVFYGTLQHLHPPPAQVFVIGRLGLDRGDDIAQRVNQAYVEPPDSLRRALQSHAVLLKGGFADVLGHILDPGVQSRHGGVFHGADLIL